MALLCKTEILYLTPLSKIDQFLYQFSLHRTHAAVTYVKRRYRWSLCPFMIHLGENPALRRTKEPNIRKLLINITEVFGWEIFDDGSAMDYGVNSVRVNGCEWISIVPVQHDPHFSNNTVCHIILSLIMAHYTMRNTSFSHKYFIYLTNEIFE